VRSCPSFFLFYLIGGGERGGGIQREERRKKRRFLTISAGQKWEEKRKKDTRRNYPYLLTCQNLAYQEKKGKEKGKRKKNLITRSVIGRGKVLQLTPLFRVVREGKK